MAIEIEERVRQFINAHRIARLATVDAAGNPSVIPICYVFQEASFYSAIDAKPKRVDLRQLQRIRNIRVNPNVALVIDDYSENWFELAYVLLHGRAEIIESTESVAAERAAAITALRFKYAQYRSMAIDRNPIIKIVPNKVRFWSSAP
jgi:PPOX class probable F420-dependent enzyme